VFVGGLKSTGISATAGALLMATNSWRYRRRCRPTSTPTGPCPTPGGTIRPDVLLTGCFGWNNLGLEFSSPSHGCCRDALHVNHVNGNQAAESMLAFLLSLVEMRFMQNALTVFHEPALAELAAQ